MTVCSTSRTVLQTEIQNVHVRSWSWWCTVSFV